MPRRCWSRSASGMMTSSSMRPATSSRVQPKICSACGFQSTIRPAASMAMTASSEVSTTWRSLRSEVSSAAMTSMSPRNSPNWLPREPNIRRTSWSGALSPRPKNSSTPTTASCRTTGSANPTRRPSAMAVSFRWKSDSWVTSGTQILQRVSHTRPGRPTPRTHVSARVAATKRSTPAAGRCQTAAQRSTSASVSTSHSAPTSLPSRSQNDCRTGTAATSTVDALARMRVTACCTSLRRAARSRVARTSSSASRRAVTSMEMPVTCSGAPLASRTTTPVPCIQRTVPSGHTTR